MIQEGYAPGKGSDVLNYSSRIMVPPVLQGDGQFSVWLELKTTVEKLVSFVPVSFLPEVGMNVAYALPDATTRKMVCAVDGRIMKYREQAFLCGTLDFGVSKHAASIVLAAMSFDREMRSALNIRYSQKTVDLCRKIGLTVGSFDRKSEPMGSSSTMEWGTKQAIAALGRVPDIIYDTGGVGKEPMIRILGKNPEDVLSKLQKLVKHSIS
jgi:hydroxymethylpyrimidine/phosphomethylpyrimidine kinase